MDKTFFCVFYRIPFTIGFDSCTDANALPYKTTPEEDAEDLRVAEQALADYKTNGSKSRASEGYGTSMKFALETSALFNIKARHTVSVFGPKCHTFFSRFLKSSHLLDFLCLHGRC